MKVKFTELNSGYKGEHRVARFTGESRSKMIIAMALVSAFVFVLLLSLVGIIPISALLLRARVGLSGENDRLPIAINTESTIDSDVLGDCLVILSTENVTVYSSEGKMLYSQPHVFSKPAISVNGNKAIVFDRGGKGFILLNDNKIIYEGTASATIISAEYGSNGFYALGTKGDSATSMLTVYNKQNKSVFQWKCAYEYIVAISLSDNGKYVGCAVAGAKNGEAFTTVQFFGVDYKEPLNTQTIKGAIPFDIGFTKSDTLMLITDVGVYSVTRKGEKYTECSKYYSSEFNSCQLSPTGQFIVTLAKYGSKNVFEINLFSRKGDLKETISTDCEIKSTYISEKYIFALAEDKVLVYNLNGKCVSEIEFKGEAFSLLPTDDFVFITSLDKITRCFTYGDSSVALTS